MIYKTTLEGDSIVTTLLVMIYQGDKPMHVYSYSTMLGIFRVLQIQGYITMTSDDEKEYICTITESGITCARLALL